MNIRYSVSLAVRVLVIAALAAALLVTSQVATEPAAIADHGGPTSTGIYRIPYADGLVVGVNNDAHNHNDAYDMSAGEDAEIVAAASGWIRAIVDFNGEEPNAGDGLDVQNPPQAQDDFLEHACGNNDPANTVATSCADHNNYVWIEHPNGEYTKYSHLGTGTVSATWAVDDWINAGEVIGLENDIGAASSGNNADPEDRAFHLHFEVAAANTAGTDLTWTTLGGFITNGTRRAAVFCDIPDNDLLAGNSYTANPCAHTAPTADAGGPYVVDEGSTVQLTGAASNDPDGNPLTYAWAPATNLDDASLVAPIFTGVDDVLQIMVLSVYDQIEALPSQDFTSVTVNNVAPTVVATGDSIDEAGTAQVSATFTDPGVLDTHTVSIDWGDTTPTQAATPAALAGGVTHVYGDNGTYAVTVIVTDDDGGSGFDVVDVVVANLGPSVVLDTTDAISFPGGDYVVTGPGDMVEWSATGSDPGSDDLTFDWNTGDSNTYFNDGIAADPFPSPLGVFPFVAADNSIASYGDAGVGSLTLALTDDDGGSDNASANVITTGDATSTAGDGWWKHQYSGKGNPHLDPALADAYLDIVNAVSLVFSEDTALASHDDAHDVLSPTGNDKRARARAALLSAWLQFASGAVAWDAAVPASGASTIDFLTLMFDAEQLILDPTASNGDLVALRQQLDKVRHA